MSKKYSGILIYQLLSIFYKLPPLNLITDILGGEMKGVLIVLRNDSEKQIVTFG
jgi:hypothetical protein